MFSNNMMARKMIYRWDDILANEADAFTGAAKDSFLQIAKSFPIPPKGCKEQVYLRARDRFPYILNWWKKQLSTELNTTLTRLTADPLIYSIIAFEIANYLVSAGISEPFHFEIAVPGVSYDQTAKAPIALNKKELQRILKTARATKTHLEKLAKNLRGVMPHMPNAFSEALQFAHKIESFARNEIVQSSSAKRVLFFQDLGFMEKKAPKISRKRDLAIAVLTVRLREALNASAKLSHNETYQLVAPLLNSATDLANKAKIFRYNAKALQKKADSAKKIFQLSALSTYSAIIVRIPNTCRHLESCIKLNTAIDIHNETLEE